MTVITLSNCPPRVRGDLTMWLCEINTGVYVGEIGARVRDELWKRVCANLKNGSATMVFTAPNEQHMDFRVHNSSWEPIDFDGLKLVMRPSSARINAKAGAELKSGFSNAAKFAMARRREQAKNTAPARPDDYAVFDVETTGLSECDDEIIEIAAILVRAGEIVGEFQTLVRAHKAILPEITKLTGITDQMLVNDGVPLDIAIREFLQFIGERTLVSHNAMFDCGFISTACQRCGYEPLSNRCIDTLKLAKRKRIDVPDFKLASLARHFGLNIDSLHRSMPDCLATMQVFSKLNEIP